MSGSPYVLPSLPGSTKAPAEGIQLEFAPSSSHPGLSLGPVLIAESSNCCEGAHGPSPYGGVRVSPGASCQSCG